MRPDPLLNWRRSSVNTSRNRQGNDMGEGKAATPGWLAILKAYYDRIIGWVGYGLRKNMFICLSQPVFQPYSRHTFKVPNVSGDKNQVVGNGG